MRAALSGVLAGMLVGSTFVDSTAHAQPAGSGSASAPASASEPAAAEPSAAGPEQDATQPAPGGSAPSLRESNAGPWLLVGGSIAFLTIGAVLGYSAEAAENDLQDLYVGLEGTPPPFDARVQERYDDLIAEGERYERLSWMSFGVAGALGLGAAIWFYVDRDQAAPAETKALRITPTLRRDGGGVAAMLRF